MPPGNPPERAGPKRQRLTLALRVLMEAGIVAAFAYWGYHVGASADIKIVLAVGAPVLGFGFWGAVDFRQAGPLAEPLRLVQELIISGLAAVALYAAGQHILGWALGLLSLGYHALVYLQGGRLLKHPPRPTARGRTGSPATPPPRGARPRLKGRNTVAWPRMPVSQFSGCSLNAHAAGACRCSTGADKQPHSAMPAKPLRTGRSAFVAKSRSGSGRPRRFGNLLCRAITSR